MTNIPHIDPSVLADPAILKGIRPFVEQYAALRARAVHSVAAFRRVFGTVNCDNQVYTRIQNLEASDIYCDLFDAKLKAIPLDEMLSPRKALHAYLDIAANPMSKDSAKIAALKEACVIANITVIDEKGNTRAGRALADFYKDTPENEELNRIAADIANPVAARARAAEADKTGKLH